MIEIKGQWEQVVTMDDCLRVISYHLGLEFANKVQELVEKEGPDKEGMRDAIDALEGSSYDLDNVISDLDSASGEIKRAVSDLRIALKESGAFK